MTDLYLNAAKDFKTIIDFLRFGITRANANNIYYGHGTDNAWDDILTLILRSLSLPHDIDPSLFHGQLTQEEKVQLCRQLERRIQERIPVPYLIKEAYFCHLPFYVDERVLIPRSPIAELIEQQFSPWINPEQVYNILDLCTGSACIAIACCYAFPQAQVDAVDISEDALAVAAINRDRYELHGTLSFIQSNCFDTVPAKKYDIIVSNPPYVGDEEMKTLPVEYTHEPKLALEAKNNGLAIVENILFNAHAYLEDHGILVVEVGNSEEALAQAYPDVPFTWLDFERGGGGIFLLTAEQLKAYFVKK